MKFAVAEGHPKAELAAAARWYAEAIYNRDLPTLKEVGLAFDERGCVTPQTIHPYRPTCKHQGWRQSKVRVLLGGKCLSAVCPRCNRDISEQEFRADREYFRDLARTTEPVVEHGAAIEREFEVERWRKLTRIVESEPALDTAFFSLFYRPQDRNFFSLFYPSRDLSRKRTVRDFKTCPASVHTELPLPPAEEEVDEVALAALANIRWFLANNKRRGATSPVSEHNQRRERDGIQRRATHWKLRNNGYARYSGREHAAHPPHHASLEVVPFTLKPLPYTDEGMAGAVARLQLMDYALPEIAKRLKLLESHLRLLFRFWSSKSTSLERHSTRARNSASSLRIVSASSRSDIHFSEREAR